MVDVHDDAGASGVSGAGGVSDTSSASGAAGASGAATASPLATQIAAALRRERARAGVSLTELARRAGIAKSTLSQLESGSGNPSVETLWALGTALGVPFAGWSTPRVRPYG